ncbi:MAG: hypothetical protein EXR98_14860 [Gemmataceae bacterium]|nr:hypothetical protein [Gemmataceae bacterium]
MKLFASALLILACALPAPAQPPAPLLPAKYKVALRYYIPAPRDQHVVQYDALIRHLQRLDFEFEPPLEKHADTDREDRGKNYLKGVIKSANALKLLDASVVQSIQLVPYAPDEFKLPDGANDPVSVRLELAGNLTADRQRELANQLRVLLHAQGFKEPVGYDHRGYNRGPYTRIVGTIPKSKLDLLNRDLRNHPAGWLGPILPPDELPTPLRYVNPVRVVEVLPDTAAIKELTDPEPREPEYLEKISADLWEQVKGKDVLPFPVRVQVGFVGTITPDDVAWKLTLQESVPGFVVEGQLGQFVTGMIRLDLVKRLAAAPNISVIRLPRVQAVNVDPGIKIQGDNAKARALTGLTELHKRGYEGKGVRIGIIDRDFHGWETLVKKKLLSAKTRLVDLTFDRDPDVYRAPYTGDPAQIGHGTLCAQAAALAAPAAELVLIRADVKDPYQLHEIVRYTQAAKPSPSIEQRHGELEARTAQLKVRRDELLEERRLIFNDFTDQSDLKEYLGFLGPFFSWLYSDREWHLQRMAFHEKLETEQRLREDRFRRHLKEVESLNGIPILVNALSWNSGYPLGATSPLSKALDDPKGPLWFQAVGNTRGQTWLGPFRQVAGDPALKFTDDETPLPKGRWSNEVNFLAWQPYKGDAKPDLPAKAKLRLTIQWREPHDPDYYLRSDERDEYRKPLAHLRLQLLRQRDPETKALTADLFEQIARTSGLPERIEHLPGGSVYEHVLEVPLETAGRYALRVEKQVNTQWLLGQHPIRKTPMFQLLEGLTPTGIRPLGVPNLPAFEKDWELRPRIFVEVIDDANRVQGRAAFADFATDAGSIGLPADSRNVISVGAANFKQKPQPFSVFGSPSGMEMARRPWLYAYDELELAGGGAFGTSIANAFAAGTVAAMLSGNLTREEVVQMLREQEGQVLRVPIRKKE